MRGISPRADAPQCRMIRHNRQIPLEAAAGAFERRSELVAAEDVSAVVAAARGDNAGVDLVGDDRNHDQQLDERKTGGSVNGPIRRMISLHGSVACESRDVWQQDTQPFGDDQRRGLDLRPLPRLVPPFCPRTCCCFAGLLVAGFFA